MASNQKKTQQRKHKQSWFLCCFGLSRKPASDKKTRKPACTRKRLFRLCLPKLKIISIRKRKVRLDTKASVLKATQNIMFEASKVQQQHQLKLQYHASNTQLDQPKRVPKESNNWRGQDQSGAAMCVRQDRESKSKPEVGSTPMAKLSFFASDKTKDSFIGGLIMVVTLITLLVWGRLCAILCMSAWFYCVPLLRPARNLNVASNEDSKLDLDSGMRKKKVVLEGILQRDHKIARIGNS